jgi:hypothetical protein
MDKVTNFETELAQTADRLLEEIEKNSPVSSWNLKNKLSLSACVLYMALGYLLSRNKITLTPGKLTYTVKNTNHFPPFAKGG